MTTLSRDRKKEFLERGFTRRHFGRISALIGGAAGFSFYNESALAQLSRIGPLPPGAVKINSNESPWGPSPAALEALKKVALEGNRYQGNETRAMLEAAARSEGLTVDNYIAKLRTQLEPSPHEPQHIVTVHGSGYQLIG